MNARVYAVTALLLLAAASFWLRDTAPEDPSNPQQRPLNDGYYVLDALISDTNETGQLIYSLRAARIDHVPADGSVQLTDLSVLYSGDAQDNWNIEARRGFMGAARDHLQLRGDVRISSARADELQPTTIRTEQLDLDINRNVASSEQTVRIQLGDGELTANGMTADLNAKTIDLLADVRGSFGDAP